MKRLILAFIVAICAVGACRAEEKDKPYLLVYLQDVGYRHDGFYLQTTTNPPRIYVTVARSFETTEKAMKFVNDGFFDSYTVLSVTTVHNPDGVDLVPEYDRKPRLYKVAPVAIRQVKTGDYEQTEMRAVKVTRDKMEWRVIE